MGKMERKSPPTAVFVQGSDPTRLVKRDSKRVCDAMGEILKKVQHF